MSDTVEQDQPQPEKAAGNNDASLTLEAVRSFYVYALHAPCGATLDGRPDVRYIGGAYGNANRINEHSATRGAKSTRTWFREVEAAGHQVMRRVLVVCSEAAMWDDKMEQRVWDAYKKAGHGLLNERPMTWSREAQARGRAAQCTSEGRARASVRNLRTASRPGESERRSMIQTQVQNRPGMKERKKISNRAAANRQGVREKISAGVVAACARPDVREKKSRAARVSNNRPEVKEKIRIAAAETNARPEVKSRRSASQRDAQNRPAVKAKRDATKEKRSDAARAAHARPEVKERRRLSRQRTAARPEFREQCRASALEVNARPGMKERKRAAMLAWFETQRQR